MTGVSVLQHGLVALLLMALLHASLCTAKPTHSHAQEGDKHSFGDWLKAEADDLSRKRADLDSLSYGKVRLNDKNADDLADLLLPKLLRRLRDSLDRVPAQQFGAGFEKREAAFWQPMGGPLPVETRLVSFGSRLEPERNREDSQSVIKAMRYGRR